MIQTRLEHFNSEYLLAPSIEVNRHRGDLAVLDADVYADLAQTLGEPIIGYTGGLHYEFAPSRNVLSERAAVPTRNHSPMDERMALLLRK